MLSRAALVLALSLLACGDAQEPTRVAGRETTPLAPKEAPAPAKPPSAPAPSCLHNLCTSSNRHLHTSAHPPAQTPIF